MKGSAFVLAGLLLAGCSDPAPFAAGVPGPPAPEPPPVPSAAEAVRDRAKARGPLSLTDCLAMAEAQSERLAAALEEIRIAEARQRLARSSTLPGLSANAEHRRQEDIGSSSSSTLPERSETRLALSQPVFRGFKDLHACRSARLLAEASERSREGVLLEIRLSVCEAYGRLLSLERQRDAVASSLALALSRLEELRARMRVGLSRRTDVLFAEAQAARNESQRIRLEGERDDARAFLAFLIGCPVEAPLAPFPALDVPSLDPDTLTARALERRQDLAALERQAASAEEDVRTEKAGRWPSVDLAGNLYGKREGTSKGIDWDVALLGSLPLFEGGAVSARVRQAEGARRKAELALREKRRQIAQAVQEAVSAYRSSKAALDSLERENRAAEENEGLLREEVRQGIATRIEHLTAQDTLLAARVELARQRIQDRLSALAVWAALGEFPTLPPEEASR